ncbi:protein SCARECROW-like [Cucurbita moschata]|uniref:Protein SCARECROW-like n=1 Tax=Cucurbita moschata TaxID=3662 RepID=A0A6J1H5L3_CUCMO|nr:protein SCARECROW-like [Cucurbita moschata]
MAWFLPAIFLRSDHKIKKKLKMQKTKLLCLPLKWLPCSFITNLSHPYIFFLSPYPQSFAFPMKLGRPEVDNGCLLQPPDPDEPWDFELPSSSTSNTPIFHNQAFNLQSSNEFAYSVDHVNDLLESSTDDTTNGDELQVHVGNERSKDVDDHGLTLISLLFECSVAISVDNLVEAHRMLLELTQMASPYGQSSAERVVTYFAAAMSSRVINSILGICSPLLDYKSISNSFQIFNNVSPLIKFAHLASNQTILESLSQCVDPIHIIDLDIMQGMQWPPLFQALTTKMDDSCSRHVRITAMGTTMELLLDTGKQLSNIARQLGLSFEYNPIATKVGKVDISMVKLRQGEMVVVNWVQHCLYDATGSDWKTLGLIQQLGPKVFTFVEQDMCHGGSYLDRFVSSLHYYSAIFDSLGACLSSNDSNRNQVEHNILYREINNILAIGGSSRSGEEKLKEWRSELRKCLMEVPMSANSMAQAWLMLNMQSNNQGFSLVQGEGGALKLRWKDTSLYTASSWTRCNVGVA